MGSFFNPSFGRPLSELYDKLQGMEVLQQKRPSFWVGTIPIDGDLILSPMDGLSNLPFRSLARSLGSAMSYTEFINARDVVFGHPHLERKLTYLECERPVVYQIFDSDPEMILQGVGKLMTYHPDIIDVNMGCPDKSVSGRGAGVGLMRTPEKIAQIFSTLSRELDIPVTGKIRLGWDDESRNYLEVARIVEDNGGQLLAVHGRTKAQKYGGQADWEPIAEIKQALSIPVIGNGDVRTVADIERIKSLTGCDGVMIARAALHNPWIFQRLDRHEVPPEQVLTTMHEHLEKNMSFYGKRPGLVQFRKYATRILQPLNLEREFRLKLLTCEEPGEFIQLLGEALGVSPAIPQQ